MKDKVEVVIIEVVPKMFDIVNTPEKFSHRVTYIKEMYEVNQPITHRPEYLAVREPGDCRIELLFKIDPLKSNFEKGQLVPQGKPIFLQSYLRLKEPSTTHIVYTPEGAKEEGSLKRTIWYTSFRTLLTHDSSDEFIEETSKFITRVIMEERILCNGFYCKHFSYCKYFNHSENPNIKSSSLPKRNSVKWKSSYHEHKLSGFGGSRHRVLSMLLLLYNHTILSNSALFTNIYGRIRIGRNDPQRSF